MQPSPPSQSATVIGHAEHEALGQWLRADFSCFLVYKTSSPLLFLFVEGRRVSCLAFDTEQCRSYFLAGTQGLDKAFQLVRQGAVMEGEALGSILTLCFGSFT